MEINNSELQAVLDKITELRHELHRIPEASMKEYKTRQAIMAFIADNTALEIVDRGTWFYAAKKIKSFRQARCDCVPRGYGRGVRQGWASGTLLWA